MTREPTVRTPARGRTIAFVGVPLAEGATTALPPAKEEIERLLAVAPKYGIEIRVPGH
jgi:hypothetical protein